MSMCCNDCKHINTDVGEGACATCQIVGGPTLNFEFVPGRRNAPDPDKEGEKGRELEVWRQAYNAALSGYDIQRCLAERTDYCATYDPKERADQALADYRAKREELLK